MDLPPSNPHAKLCFVGAGALASTAAYKLVAQKGYTDVTMVARNKRLAQLQRDGAIKARDVNVDKDPSTVHTAAVKVCAELDADVAYDIVFCFVLGHQMDEKLRALLVKSKARKVVFMAGTVRPLAELRDLVGALKFAYGFSASIQAWFPTDEQDVVEFYLESRASIFTDAECARVWSDVGCKTKLVSMAEAQSAQRYGTCLFIALCKATIPAVVMKRSGASWSEARCIALALQEWWAILHELGEEPVGAHRGMTRLPAFAWTLILMGLSRASFVRGRFEGPVQWALAKGENDFHVPETRAHFNEFVKLVGPERAKRVEALRP